MTRPNPKTLNCEGKKFGTLTVLEIVKSDRHGRRARVRCDCGTVKTVHLHHFTRPDGRGTKTCGEGVHARGYRHGYSVKGQVDPLYHAWFNIKQRCYSESNPNYARYGGRGIKMYKPWINKPELFIRWVEKNLGPKPRGHSLDRINNDGNYVPGNLRWASPREQSRNRSLSRDLPPGITKSGKQYVVQVRIGFPTLKAAKSGLAEVESRLSEYLT